MNSFEKLKTILKQMIDAHDKLLQVGEEKQKALIQGDHERLLSIFPKESALIKEISTLEEKRQEETISYHSLSEIIADSYFFEEKEELIFYQNELKDKIKQLEEQHALNRQLIGTSLTYVNNMLALFTQPQEQPITYTAKNSFYPKDSSAKGFFDAKI